MSPLGSPPPETQDETESLWRHQQRLLSASQAATGMSMGDSGDELYRDVFTALRQEPLPGLPDDFAACVAADAQRLVDARAQVSRFKTMLASLLSLLYLPAMLAVTLIYGVELLQSLQTNPGSWSWVAVLTALAIVPSSFDRLMRRGAAGPAGGR
jgi:hypothetical protein